MFSNLKHKIKLHGDFKIILQVTSMYVVKKYVWDRFQLDLIFSSFTSY